MDTFAEGLLVLGVMHEVVCVVQEKFPYVEEVVDGQKVMVESLGILQ